MQIVPRPARLLAAARTKLTRVVPETSPLFPLLRGSYRALRDLPERLVDIAIGPIAVEGVRDAEGWRRALAAARCPPWHADAEAGPEGAAGLVIELAMREATRFPRALTAGPDGEFAAWIRDTQPRLSARAADNVRATLADPPGERVLTAYRCDTALRERHPLALTPSGRAAWLRWILNPLRRRALGLDAHHIVWWSLACDEDEALGVVQTWLGDPELQRRFPGPLVDVYPRLRAWAEAELGLPPLPVALPPRWHTPSSTAPWQTFRPGARIEGVNLLGPLAFASGLGEAARNTARAARIAGLDVSARDIPIGRDAVSPLALGLEHHPVTLVHVPGGGHTEHAHRAAGWWRRPGVYRIGVWYWELDRLPPEWRLQGTWLDEVWCPTTFIANAARDLMTVPVVPMFPGIEPPRFEPRSRERLGLPRDRFLFLFMFDMWSYFERKNPLAAIRAFRRAFGAHEPAGLVIKVSRGASNPAAMRELRAAAGDGVTIVDRVLARDETYALMQSCDAYVSLHRSEGFGLTMAEAMSLGKPVIATAYSGNLDFMTPQTSCLVGHRLIPIERAVGPYPSGARWADPDDDEAARAMRWVYDDREGARAMGARAREAIVSLTSLEAYADRIVRRLGELGAPRQ